MTHYVRIGHNRVLMMLLPQKNRRRLLLSLEKLGAHPILQSFVGILVSCRVQKKERRKKITAEFVSVFSLLTVKKGFEFPH